MYGVIFVKSNFSRKRNKKPFIAFLCVLLSLLMVFVYVFEVRVLPVIKEVAASQAENVATNVIENAIIQVLEENHVTYSSLVDVEKDSSGRITAIKADTVEMNILKSKISSEVSKKILEMDSREIRIPLGTMLGTGMFSGKGPKIRMSVTLSSNVNSLIENKFSSAGINQTLHEIIVNITAAIFVVMPGTRTTAQVNTNFCVAQTVIIGTVPETFAELQKQGVNSNE